MSGFMRSSSGGATRSRVAWGASGGGLDQESLKGAAGPARRARRMMWIALVVSLGACTSTRNDAPLSHGSNLASLPLVEVPARRPGNVLAVMLTGDGNWADLDSEVASTLADSGIAVVGLKSRSYLREGQRTPDGLAEDVTAVLRHYMSVRQRDSVMIIGYSRGADFVPFVANRLPDDLHRRLELVAMLGLAPYANFQFHWVDLLHDSKRDSDVPTLPELARLGGVHALCIFGREETNSACQSVDFTSVRTIERGGGHHFDGDYPALGDAVINAMRSWSPGYSVETVQ